MNPTPEQGAVIRQAAEWHQRLKQGALDPGLRRDFRTWMRSPEHVHELAYCTMIDVLLQQCSLDRRLPRALPKNVIPFEQYATVAPPRVPQASTRASAPRPAAKKLAAAAALVLAVMVTGIASLMSGDRVIVTRQGQWDKQLLDDGTIVHAGPRTKLRFDFNDKTRAVTLVRGEALFEVAKEPSRPFIVSTDAGTVRAIGTEFATLDRGDTVVVTVAEGKVAVTGGSQSMLPVTANQQVVLSSAGASSPIAVNADRELKWIRDWYEFDGERVGDIIAELNHRHELRIVVDDPQIARLRINPLSFKPSQPADFVAKINRWYADFPGRTATAGEDVVHLDR